MKTAITDLAIFGGTPEFDAQLHVGRPNIGNRDVLMQRINDMLDRRWLTNNGPYVQELEHKLGGYLGVKHLIVMNNGTIALEIAARALGLKGEVIVPSFTFVATPHSLQWQEITPVFCDVAPGSHHIDPARIEALITPRTTGILGVHVWGAACDVDALQEIAQRRHLKLMFDAAHALGSSYKGRMIGNFGDAEVFSFHATKFFNSFEGGAIATNDDALADRIRYMRNFGFAGYDNVEYVGSNGKMSEVCAAMGLTSFDDIDHLVATNFRNYSCYKELLAGMPGVCLYQYDEREHNNFQYIVLEIDETLTGISRDTLVKILHAENILARRYFYPGCHQMEPYRSYFPHAKLLLQETEKLTQRVMSLPTGTQVNEDEIRRVCALIRFAIEHASELHVKI